MLKVLVAESDANAREQLIDLLSSSPGIDLVGCTGDGRRAIAMVKRLRPTLVLMGIDLKSVDGFQATREIMADCPTSILIVSGCHTSHEVDVAVRAIRAGALSVIALPSASLQDRSAFLSKMNALADVKLVRRWHERRTTAAQPALAASRQQSRPRPMTPLTSHVVAIASSTGGPAVLETILRQLDADFAAPILIVQHIATGFTEGLTAWLGQITPLRVRVAVNGEELKAGVVYFAPDDRHLGVSPDGAVALSKAGPIKGFRPSANHLFTSVARAYGNRAIAVILTGMGNDGSEGLQRVSEAGGYVIAQDEATSVVFGMPRAAIESGTVNAILPRDAIGKALKEKVRAS